MNRIIALIKEKEENPAGDQFFQECIYSTYSAIQKIPKLVENGFLSLKEGETLEKILTFTCDRSCTLEDVPVGAVKAIDNWLCSNFNEIGTTSPNLLDNTFNGRGRTIDILTVIFMLNSKLTSSVVLKILEKRRSWLGYSLVALLPEYEGEHFKNLASIGYLTHEAMDILEKIRLYKTFDLNKIQDRREREKVAEVAIYYLINRLFSMRCLIKNSVRMVIRKNRPYILETMKHLRKHIHYKAPQIFKTLLYDIGICKQELAYLNFEKAVVKALGFPAKRYIPDLLKIAEEISHVDKCSRETKEFPLTLLRNTSMKPTEDHQDSLIQALLSKSATIRSTAIVLIERMD